MNTKITFDGLDKSQLPIVQAAVGYHLVLAPPGCGKTHILAERVRFAHEQGIPFQDMLCLTFTNRAAREMISRIEQAFPNTDTSALQVGNVHHFCSRFLFEKNKIASDASIIDDEEAISIIADHKNEDDTSVIGDYKRFKGYQQIIFFSHLMYQMKRHHQWELYLHPECLNDDDREAIRYFCNTQKMTFNEQAILEIYAHAETYMDDIYTFGVSRDLAAKMKALLDKMYYAACYEKAKTENHLLDFEDLLLFTYDVYKKDTSCKRYPWVQVDEVQDLNNMQLAIIDLLTDTSQPLVMYLGDEQQAIFSFMGAKADVLNTLKLRCKRNIHHLMQNHRSPKYLLDVFNTYAEKQLGIDPQLLPITASTEQDTAGNLSILTAKDFESEMKQTVELAHSLYKSHPNERTAIIVNANIDADKLSKHMDTLGLHHFKVSGRDLFDTPDMKLLLAHLSVIANEHNFIAWTRIMKIAKVLETNALSRRFNKALKQLALSPTDLLNYDKSSYVMEFLKAYQEEDIVVFDTETTGLNVFDDDIIEISAIRIKGGEIVGEPLDLYLYTDRPILKLLGEKENPLYDFYHQKLREGTLLQPAEALRQFIDFIGDSTLLGHNVNYDYNILDNCLKRHANTSMTVLPNRCFDSLKLIRLLDPSLRSYKLEHLLERFNLKGENSHRSIDDVKATISLVDYCASLARQKVAAQMEFINNPKVKKIIRKLKSNYNPIYQHAIQQLYKLRNDDTLALNEALDNAYRAFLADGLIDKIDRIDYVNRYIAIDLIDNKKTKNCLYEQLSSYIMDLNTMKESDFCNSKSIQERVYVTTIHKSKGLEFENVIVFDAADGRFPNAFNKSKQADEEDARKFYVAISRAKRRLFITFAQQQTDRYHNVHTRELTPFMNSIAGYFNLTHH